MTDTLWQSFANANTAAREVEAVHAAIEQAVLDGALGAVRASDDEWSYDSWSDDDDWVASYSIQSVRIRDVGARGAARGMARGTLSIAISLYRPEDRAGTGWTGRRRAKIYAGVAPTQKAWDMDSMLLDGSGRSDAADARSTYLWAKLDAPQAWFFCVALEAIDSREALGREVMAPLAALLAGADEEAAFEGCSATFRAVPDPAG